METTPTIEVNNARDLLELKVAQATEAFSKVYETHKKEISHFIDDIISRGGFTNDKVTYRIERNDYIEIRVSRTEKEGWTHDFTIYYDEDWKTGKRTLKYNVGTFGAFCSTDVDEVYFYRVVGHFVNYMEHLARMLETLDWNTYGILRSHLHSCQYSLKDYDKQVKAKEEEKKRNEIMKSLVVGVKIDINVGSRNRKVTEIVKVNPKTLTLGEYHWGRVKITEAVDHILGGSWAIVDPCVVSNEETTETLPNG